MQEEIGLEGVTDGEFRRGSWHMGFIYQIGGITKAEQRLNIRFRNESGAVECINELTAKKLEHFMEVAKNHAPSMRGVPTGFRPRSGLGLFIYRGAASFRRVVVEPLAGGG